MARHGTAWHDSAAQRRRVRRIHLRNPGVQPQHLRLTLGELPIADVRAQVTLSFVTDFENYSVFTPAAHREAALNAVLDQTVAWSGALQALRVGSIGADALADAA